MAEWKLAQWATGSVKVAIPHLHPLVVDSVGAGAEVSGTRAIVQRPGPSNRQLRRRVDFAKEYVGDAVAALIAAEKLLHDRAGAGRPGHLDRHTRLVDDDGVGIGSEDRSNKDILRAREAHVIPVIAFRFPFFVGTNDADSHCFHQQVEAVGDLQSDSLLRATAFAISAASSYGGRAAILTPPRRPD